MEENPINRTSVHGGDLETLLHHYINQEKQLNPLGYLAMQRKISQVIKLEREDYVAGKSTLRDSKRRAAFVPKS